MKRLRLFIMENRLRVGLWLVGICIGYLLTPSDIIHSRLAPVGYVFSIVFATTSVCALSSIKVNFQRQRLAGKSYLGIVVSIFGLVGLQACGIGGAFCGVTTGMSIISVIFPAFMVSTLHTYGIYIVVISVIAQILFLYHSGCLRQMKRSLILAVKQG